MKKLILICIFGLLMNTGCESFLDEKSDKKLTIPESLEDLQALMNNTGTYNIVDSYLGEVSSDDIYLTDADLNGLASQSDQRVYTWQKDHLFTFNGLTNDWQTLYSLVYLSNTVVERLEKIDRTAQNYTQYDDILGQAYFNRARAYFSLLQLWAKGYDRNSSSSDPGIVIRETTDFNLTSKRSSVEEGYGYVLNDFHAASKLLPLNMVHPIRPGRQASLGYLARVYLSMREYGNALNYSDSCLKINSGLLDYSTLVLSKTYPFNKFNPEVIFESQAALPTILTNAKSKIVPELYNSYSADDLRKQVFFRNNNNGTYGYRGSYGSGQGIYTGITIDEQYLIRAECNARLGNNQSSLNDLNALLFKRYKPNTFTPYTIQTAGNVTQLVLRERRKELLMRNTRWTDLKRLNIEGANIDLTRVVNGIVYNLKANDAKYALEIPEDVIERSGIQQNIR